MKNIILFILLFCSLGAMSQVENKIPRYNFNNQLGVGRTGNNDTSAYLQIGPSGGGNKGIIIPRVSGTGAIIGTPKKGLIIYDDNKDSIGYYNGTDWIYLGGSDTTGSDGALDSLRTDTSFSIVNSIDTAIILPANESLAGALPNFDKINLNRIEVVRNFDGLRAVTKLDTTIEYQVGGRGNRFYYDPSDASSADDTAMVIVSGSARFKRVIEDKIFPEFFGAVGDGSTDDAAAFNKMFRWIEAASKRNYTVGFKSKRYVINSRVTLPGEIVFSGLSMRKKLLWIDFTGVEIATNYAGYLFYRMPTSVSESDAFIGSYNLKVTGGNFYGGNVTGSVAFKIGSTYGTKFEDCQFFRFDTAMVLNFSLNGVIRNCYFSQSKYCDIIGASNLGYYSGSSISSTAFNANTFDGCRFFSSETAFTTIKLMAADQTRVVNCISEGDNPLYNFYYDCQNSTNVNINTFENIWIESNGGANTVNTNFYLSVANRMILKNIQRIYPNKFFKLASDSRPNAFLIIDGIPYDSGFPTGAYDLDGDDYSGYRIQFDNIRDPATATTGSLWSTGIKSQTLSYTANENGNITRGARAYTEVLTAGKYITTPTGLRLNYTNTSSISNNAMIVAKAVPSAAIPSFVSPTDANAAFIAETSKAAVDIIYANNSSSFTSNPQITLKSMRGTFASPTTLTSGNYLGTVKAYGYDGTTAVNGGAVRWIVDGTVSTGVMPSRFDIYTMNTSGTLLPGFTVRATGNVELPVVPAVGALSDSILVRNTTAGEVKKIATTNFTNNAATTTGDVQYYNGTTWVRLGIGTAGQVLRVNSGATALEYATPSSGGGSGAFTGDLD